MKICERDKLIKYVDKMKNFNKWEEEYYLNHPLSEEEKLNYYFELMDLVCNTIIQERIDNQYREKLARLIKERKMLLQGYKKYTGKNI